MFVLDADFNQAILTITTHLIPQGFDISPHAPSTYAELKALVAGTGRLVVYDGASEHTIYGNPAVNHAFRAWHDFCHLAGSYDTTFSGEVAACRLQVRHLLQHYGDSDRTWRWQRIVEAEIVGQALHFERHGCFPIDQSAFVQAYLKSPDLAQRARY